MKQPVAIQLYTLRDETAKDFVGTLEKVAKMGYKGVEFAGYGNLSAKEMKGHLDRLGLKAVGSHVGLNILEEKLDEAINYCLEIGCKYIVCPWSDLKTKEECEAMIKKLSDIGAKCREKGLKLCYHNHAHEFVEIDGEYVLDTLFKSIDPSILMAEVDTHWVQRAKVNPKTYVKKYSGRCPLIHLKDMNAAGDNFAEVGEGIMDIYGIAAVSAEAGAEWLIVEQDSCQRPTLESAAISIENLKKLGLA